MDVVEAHRPLLRRLLPADEPRALEVRGGQFHHVVMGSDRVVCLPRTAAAAARLTGRATVLRTLAGLDLGFGAPEPLCTGGTDEPPFLVLTRVPGAPLDAGTLEDPAVAEAVAAQYAALLTGLARAGADPRARDGLPRTPEDSWRRFTADVRAELFALMSDGGRRRAQRELAALDALPHVTTAVVHGDLGAENVLWEYDDEGLPRLSGVVDWDEAALGDPAEDLAAVEAGHGNGFLRRVLVRGGWSDPALTARITTIRATFALQQAHFGLHDGDEEQVREGLAGYRRDR